MKHNHPGVIRSIQRASTTNWTVGSRSIEANVVHSFAVMRSYLRDIINKKTFEDNY